jgi:hypothetical protein
MSRLAAPTTSNSGRARRAAAGRLLPILESAIHSGDDVYFYELSEADDEILANLFVAHDAEYDESEFLDLVLEAREAVLSTFEEDSLIEAIATELEKRHGFVHVESNLRAAVRVSAEEGETAAAPVDERQATIPTEAEDFRTMLVEVESEDRPYRD